MQKAGSVFRSLIIWIFLVSCAVGLYLQDVVDEYIYYWFDLDLNYIEVAFLFLIAANTVYILILIVKLIVALFRKRKKPEIQKSPDSPKPAAPASPPPASPSSPPSAAPKYCSACGAALETGDRYCPQCGQNLPLPAPGGERA